MSTPVGKGVVDVVFDKHQISRDLSSSFEGGAKASEGSIGSTFKRLAGLATAAFAGVQVVGFVKDSIDAARESNKVAAQSEAVIKSTGGAAHVTAAEFSNLANSIAAKTGIDDEQIQSAENLLATFTNIRNEVGANNDIFTQSTKIAVDMGAALGGDASSNAILLGKALNDPVRGLTALTRVGVAFDDGQRAQIKTMQEHGDVLGAQKIILAELNKEFGGSAEATATAGAKWGVFWGNLQENFGNLLIPALDMLAEFAMTTLPVAFSFLADTIGPVFSEISGGFQAFVAAFQAGDGDVTSSGLAGWFEELGGTVRGVYDTLAEFFSTLTSGFTNQDAATGAESFALILRDDVWPIIKQIAEFIRDHWQPALVILGVALVALISPVLGLVAYWAALSAGLIWAYKNVKIFRDVVDGTAHVVMTFFHVLQDSLGPVFLSIGASLADFARFFVDRWEAIRGSVENVLTGLAIAVAVFVAPIVFIWQQFNDQILAVVEAVWNQVSLVVQTAVRIIGDVFDLITSVLTGQWGDAWKAVEDIFNAAFDFLIGSIGNLGTFIWDFFSTLPANILSALGDLALVLVPKGIELLIGLLGGIVQGAVAMWDWYLNLPATIAGYFVGAISWLHENGWGIIRGVWQGIVDGAVDIWSWFTGLPGVLVSLLAGAATWLISVGVAIVAGIVKGIRDAGPSIVSAIADQIPGVGVVHGLTSGGGGTPSGVIIGKNKAQGGIVDRPTIGLWGEKGREVILPLTDARRSWELAGQSGLIDVLAKGAASHGHRFDRTMLNSSSESSSGHQDVDRSPIHFDLRGSTFSDEVDVDMVLQKASFLASAGRFG